MVVARIAIRNSAAEIDTLGRGVNAVMVSGNNR